MNGYNVLYKILRYLVQAAVIYLLLRYFPYSNLSVQQAGAVTLIIILLCLIIEQLLFPYMKKQPVSTESFLNKFNKDCKSCKLERFEDDPIGTMDTAPPSPHESTVVTSGQNSTVVLPSPTGNNTQSPTVFVPGTGTNGGTTVVAPNNGNSSVVVSPPVYGTSVDIPAIVTNNRAPGVIVPSIGGQTSVVAPTGGQATVVVPPAPGYPVNAPARVLPPGDAPAGVGRSCRIVCSNDIPGRIGGNNVVEVRSGTTHKFTNEPFEANLGTMSTTPLPQTNPPPQTTMPMQRPSYQQGNPSMQGPAYQQQGNFPMQRPAPPQTVTQAPFQRPGNLNNAQQPDKLYWNSRYGYEGYDNKQTFGGMFYDENPFYNRFRNDDDLPRNADGTQWTPPNPRRIMADEQRVVNNFERIDERARTTAGFYGPFQTMGPKSERLRTTESRRRIEGVLDDELPYTDYNHLPIAAGYKSHDYEYGYSFLPPEKWYPQPPRAPVCVTEKRCPVCPAYANGAPADAKEFHSARRITPPDMINTDYIGDKLNAGR
jgi:hypothetical protein